MNIKTFFVKRINLIVDKLKKNYDYNLAVVAIVKDEAPYIREWIEYHKLVGVDKFYIYDNESSDNLKEVLSSYILNGEVEYMYYPGHRVQCEVYNFATKRVKFNCKYVAYIDIDEFILPIDADKKVPSIVDEVLTLYPKAAGLAVQWLMFGSSGHKRKPEGLVIENYTKCAEQLFHENMYVKTIANPRRISCFVDPHAPCFYRSFCNITSDGNVVKGSVTGESRCYELIRVNHYFTKSYEEFIAKRNRGRATSEGIYDISAFSNTDKNDVEDKCILYYADKLKEILGK